MSNIYIGTVLEHASSFATLSKIISDEASFALQAIEEALERGQTEEEIIEEWNKVFYSEESKFKDYGELIDWLENVGI